MNDNKREGEEMIYILYDGRGEDDGLEAYVADSVKELKRVSQNWPDDYQWHEYHQTESEGLKHIGFHSLAGDHPRKGGKP